MLLQGLRGSVEAAAAAGAPSLSFAAPPLEVEPEAAAGTDTGFFCGTEAEAEDAPAVEAAEEEAAEPPAAPDAAPEVAEVPSMAAWSFL